MNPKISMIVPIYNAEYYLSRCVDSLLNQTFTDYEIILVNDGSVDASARICDNYAEHHHNIKVIHQPNGGVSTARNTGLKAATGEYIMFMDSDDWIANDMFEHLYALQLKTSADIVQCGFVRVYDNKTIPKSEEEQVVIELDDQYNALNDFFNFENLTPVVWEKLYAKHIFDNLFFPDGFSAEDSFLLCDIYYKARKICVSKSIKYYYFQREDSISHQKPNLRDMYCSFLAYKNRVKVSKDLKNDYLIDLAYKGLASDFFQYYRLTHFYAPIENKKDMYAQLYKEHKAVRSLLWSNKVMTFKFKIMLEMCYFNPKLVQLFTK